MTTTSPRPAPSTDPRPCPDELWELGQRAVARARRWANASASLPVPRTAALLSRILADPEGLEFTTRFVDDVVRPADLEVAGRALQRLASRRTDFLPPALAAAMGLGGTASRLAPSVVAAAARRTFREIVGDLVVDATDKRLGSALARLRKDGNRLNVNLLGEAVLGEQEAARRLTAVADLVCRQDVDYVSVKVSAVTGPHNPWGFDEVVAHGAQALSPLYRLARDHGTFINLDMEDYKDLDLTLAVFTSILSQEDLRDYEAGIVLQAYLPDSLDAMQRLQAWAAQRRAAGGAPIKVRVVKGANLAMEAVDAQIHGWPMTTWPTKQATDTNYKRILEWAMTPERTEAVRLGVAGQNLFDIALAYEMRDQRGLAHGSAVEFEMLSGMATGLAEVVRRDVGQLLLYVPVVSPTEFDVAIAYLVRRLEENSAPENFMSGVFDIASDEAVFNRERDRFLASLADVDPTAPLPAPRRGQNRLAEQAGQAYQLPQAGPEDARRPFVSTPDSDPALADNRQWARAIAAAVPSSQRGAQAVASGAARLSTTQAVDAAVELVREAAAGWAGLGAEKRAAIVHRAGDVLARRRGELIEVAASEAGKTIDQSDPEVSEAIDFCHHYAQMSLELESPEYLAGARFVPSRLTVVASPWNFPLAIPVGGVAAALATGSGVILKPAPPAKRCAAELVAAFHEAGIPSDVLMLAPIDDGETSRHLVTHPGADRVILTGSYDTARLFRSWKTDMHLLGETSGKNAIIVTPSADPDLAVRDTVASAFAHAGQKCSASSLLILVGSAGRSERIARQLVDATASLTVAGPERLDSQVGPVVVADEPKALRGLTTLGPGEHWVLRPRHLGGGLWRPGIRAGVVPGSEFHLTEYFAPVLGVMRVDTLQEAIEAVNAVDYGLTSGLQTLDAEELDQWLEEVQAGNLYVNRGITGAIVRRQPFGGWKRSAIGSTTKAGGPSYLLGLGDLVAGDRGALADLEIGPVDPGVAGLFEAVRRDLPDEELCFLRAALAADQRAWQASYGQSRDVTGLACERNVLRYRPGQVIIRAHEGTAAADLVRVLAAGVLSRASLLVSVPEPLSPSLRGALSAAQVDTVVEMPVVWQARLADLAASGQLGAWVRILGPREQSPQERWAQASQVTGGSPDVALYTGEVTACPHSELLPFLREQAVSITTHRFGTPFDLAAGIL
ncbi:proline dehydrogenase family protein [Actinomyces slackii]|uniref:L-glutamate gamma-semialdehyde dehydrogenase n=1 Tax=Actinomyces slackii TaxID=52774 RepID=A0A448KDK6_9ACTO|nr:proline dehydrogenase family protein [Actinomyces slackii]VEG75009.1 Bifunctional protein putA [Actinomyces slackii]